MNAINPHRGRLLAAVCAAFATATLAAQAPRVDLLPGMPAPLEANDIYAANRPGQLSSVVRNFPARIYVPNTQDDTVSVIDPATYKVVETFKVGHQPQHVVPSWDMKKLWVLNDQGNTVTEIDPATAKLGETKPVE